ncbi:hypothetical protein [Solibacillus sp. CAU 1738]|uniref:hypothetical protein n=1 Tax=Solibacillus sp. CAU 1738 TaxID=3140363 RepID=UPI003261C29B
MEEKSIFEQDEQFSSLVKSAKRKSLKRTIVVSVIVTAITLFLLWALLYISIYFMYERMEAQIEESYESNYFLGANVETLGTSYDHFFVAGTTTTSFYKQVGPHLIDWNTSKHFYTILGTKTIMQTGNAFGVNNQMYQNNQQLMSFHIPEEETSKNDLDYIKALPDYYNIEVAVSFKEELSLEEMWEHFPTAQWAWIIQNGLRNNIAEEKKRDEEMKKESGNNFPPFLETDYSEIYEFNAYGLPIIRNDFITNNPYESAQIYKDQANFIKGYEAEIMRQTIGDISVEDWKVAGVVLTGKQADILPYLQQNDVRTVRIGVVVPY